MTDVVVLLGTRFSDLETHGTRWRALLVRWARDPRVTSLTVVDFPRFGRAVGVREIPSWLPGCRALDLRVPGPVGGSMADGWGWRCTARALTRRLSPSGRRLVVGATPLSAPLIGLLPAQHRAFDAVDDWRALPSMRLALRRVEAGYRAAGAAAVVTAVSDVLSDRLRQDYGLQVTTVGNGVDLQEPAQAPDGLPAGRFAVYVGNVQERVDLDLIAAAARAVPVVVAGRATDEQAARLRLLPVTWLGPVPVQQVPGLLAAASAGLLPHRRDALTESMAPMKLLEYAAAGLPIVSTDLPGIDDVPRVRIAHGPEAFARHALAATAEGRRKPPAGWLESHAWDAVSDRLLTLFAGVRGVPCR
jgi:teichuronic acid biosynthesis glycosyltransferase TuaH